MTECSVLGVGLHAPGFTSPQDAAPILRGERPYAAAAPAPPRLDWLPRNERRRTTASIRLALAAARDAIDNAPGLDPSRLATVFSSSSGDMPLVDTICAALAGNERALSPTLFHNSVHNAPAGYWSIATQARGPSASLGAYDASFAAGLLEAAILCQTESLDVLYVAYDLAMPAIVRARRPIDADFAVALALGPRRAGTPHLSLALAGDGAVSRCAAPALEALRAGNPAAHSLPLLAALAGDAPCRVQLPYHDGGSSLAIDCSPR